MKRLRIHWFAIYSIILLFLLCLSFLLAKYFDSINSTFYSSLYLNIFGGILTGLIILIYTNIKAQLTLNYCKERNEMVNIRESLQKLKYINWNAEDPDEPNTRICDNFNEKNSGWYFRQYSEYLNNSVTAIEGLKKLKVIKKYDKYYILYYIKKYEPIKDECNKLFSSEQFNYSDIYDDENEQLIDIGDDSQIEGHYDREYHINTNESVGKDTCEEWYRTLEEADIIVKKIKSNLDDIIDDITDKIGALSNSII